jgi:hypothetical protein
MREDEQWKAWRQARWMRRVIERRGDRVDMGLDLFDVFFAPAARVTGLQNGIKFSERRRVDDQPGNLTCSSRLYSCFSVTNPFNRIVVVRMVKKSAATSKPGGNMPAASAGTSIDDIFAKPLPKKQATAEHSKVAAASSAASSSSSKVSSVTPKASSSTAPAGPSELPKKKKKPKTVASFIPEETISRPVPAPAPEPSSRVVEVVDPSLARVAAQVKSVKTETGKTGKAGKKRDRKAEEDDEAFRDSRGDGPSEWGRTSTGVARYSCRSCRPCYSLARTSQTHVGRFEKRSRRSIRVAEEDNFG